MLAMTKRARRRARGDRARGPHRRTVGVAPGAGLRLNPPSSHEARGRSLSVA